MVILVKVDALHAFWSPVLTHSWHADPCTRTSICAWTHKYINTIARLWHIPTYSFLQNEYMQWVQSFQCIPFNVSIYFIYNYRSWVVVKSLGILGRVLVSRILVMLRLHVLQKSIYKYICIIIYFCGLKHINLYGKLYDDVTKNSCHAFTHSCAVSAIRPDNWVI